VYYASMFVELPPPPPHRSTIEFASCILTCPSVGKSTRELAALIITTAVQIPTDHRELAPTEVIDKPAPEEVKPVPPQLNASA
jgi:hypothetical protein